MKYLEVCLILLVFSASAHAQLRLSSAVLGAGVAEAGHPTKHVTATLGQVVVGLAHTVHYTAEAGFWFSDVVPQGTPIEPAVPFDVPTQVHLEQSYPNPFTSQTTIVYTVPYTTLVRLVVYDVMGREVVRLVDQSQAAGHYSVSFEARALPSGVYVFRLETDDALRNGTMLLLK